MREIAEHLWNVTAGIGMLALFLLANGLILLLAVKCGRWVVLRIQRECWRPADQILAKSKTISAINKHLFPPQLVNQKKARAK